MILVLIGLCSFLYGIVVGVIVGAELMKRWHRPLIEDLRQAVEFWSKRAL